MNFMIDHCSYTHDLKPVVKLKPEKNSGLNGIQTMTSAILLQCSAKLQNTRPQLRDINVLLLQSRSQQIFAYNTHEYTSFYNP